MTANVVVLIVLLSGRVNVIAFKDLYNTSPTATEGAAFLFM